jgi:hypothetical protein
MNEQGPHFEPHEQLSPEEQLRCADKFLALSETVAAEISKLGLKLLEGRTLDPTEIGLVAANVNARVFAEACDIIGISERVRRVAMYGAEDSNGQG